MKNYKRKHLAVLLLCTVLILLFMTQYITKLINSEPLPYDENKLRLKLSDTIGFIKSKWENLSELQTKNELEQLLQQQYIEALLYDIKTQKVIFIHGKYALEACNSGNEEIFGFNQQTYIVKDGYRQTTWLVYRQETLLGAAKFYIPEAKKNNNVLNKLLFCVIISCFLSVLLWIFYFVSLLRNKQKSIRLLNNSVKELALGQLAAPIPYTDQEDEIRESLVFLDRTRQNLKEMLQAKEENEQSRKLLMNYMMHDIRTPIASMRVLTEGLIDGIPKSEDAKLNYYEGIFKKITELEKLTDDLFHHVNIEAGALSVMLEEVYCDEALQPILYWINAKGFYGNLNIDYNVPHVLVKLDISRVEQALVNLITNAIKYSKDSSEIKLSVKKEENMVVFQVSDNGLGISKEDLPFIFENFYRGEKSRNREFGGTGLGLSIVKYIAEAHEGYVNVSSKLQQGSVFKIYIPLA